MVKFIFSLPVQAHPNQKAEHSQQESILIVDYCIPEKHKISRTTSQQDNKTSILLVFAYYARLYTNFVYLFIMPKIALHSRIVKDQADKLGIYNSKNRCAK